MKTLFEQIFQPKSSFHAKQHETHKIGRGSWMKFLWHTSKSQNLYHINKTNVEIPTAPVKLNYKMW